LTKNQSLAEKDVPGIVFSSIFVTNVVLLALELNFSSIFQVKSLKNSQKLLEKRYLTIPGYLF